MKVRIAAAVAVLFLAGCAEPGSQGAGAVPESSTPPPTLGSPTGPPSTPSDNQRANWIAGRITQDADGPCYGLVTDEGKVYALYSTERVALKKGDTVRVQVAPLRLKISCGEGTHLSAVKIEKVS